MSNATIGFGSILAWSATENGTYAPIAQTVDLPGPEEEIGDVKITNNDSPNRSHEYYGGGGLIEPGDFEFELVYTKAQQAVLWGMFGDGINYWWKETFPDGSTEKFPGYLKSRGLEAPTEDEAIKGTWAIKLTSASTFTAGS